MRIRQLKRTAIIVKPKEPVDTVSKVKLKLTKSSKALGLITLAEYRGKELKIPLCNIAPSRFVRGAKYIEDYHYWFELR